VSDDIEVGGAALITGRFFAYPAGVKTLTDPTSLILEWIEPDGTPGNWIWTVDAEIVHDATGLFHVLLAATSAGVWRGRWVADGDVVGTKSFTWCVLASAFDDFMFAS